jgi:hypothetical protein
VGADIVGTIDAEAAVGHLVEHGRYDLALALATTCPAPARTVMVTRALEDLAARCVHATLAGSDADAPRALALAWIARNHVPGMDTDTGGQAAKAWRLLRRYLGLYASSRAEQHIYDAVARRILREEVGVPAWLEADMCEAGMHVALATAYLDHARFDHACEVVMEYVAVLDTDMDVAAAVGQAVEGDQRVYADITGLVSWQLVARIVAGLRLMPDTARAQALRQYVPYIAGGPPLPDQRILGRGNDDDDDGTTRPRCCRRLRGRLEECSGPAWGKSGAEVMRTLADMAAN